LGFVKWPRNRFVEMGFSEREMGWRVEQRIGRVSQQLPRGFFRGERRATVTLPL
jgi:hypothetical protein